MMCLSEVAEGVGGRLIGRDTRIQGVSTDTRTLNRGELFVALKGPSFDGDAFVEAARDAGAAGAIVQADMESVLPIIQVRDPRKALGDLGGLWRAGFSIPVVAVTGSNGKTTVKEMIGSILTTHGPALISTGNLNNDIGVPRILCGLRPEHQYAVLEMGMNQPGEIRYLSCLAKPTVAVITNASPAHLEGLGTLESVVDAKGEIMAGLGAGSVLVLNREDSFFDYWCRMAGGHPVLSFGLEPGSDVYVSDYSGTDNRFRLHVRGQSIDISLRLSGRHNAANALAAAAAAFAVGFELEQIKVGLERVEPVPGRLCFRRGVGGARVLDDSYNANPASVAAGIDVLAARPGKRIVVLGDMAELGSEARALHERVGTHARSKGVDELHGFGALSAAAVEAFGPAGFHYLDRDELVERLKAEVGHDTTFLVKGSRGMHMDEIVDALVEAPRATGGAH
ncbi:MAG: UDP-N-acetylmuramoyl-tripeptide--D-alanyl-D-alanine ligase [Gammaproteobacteria bacterium]|nr:UDP-N-acetylmuramoyl-tripeptide--D-alanyl-D-alanine ligase [Gammaproteobacteria bacterium]